jgi:hypothetical protein
MLGKLGDQYGKGRLLTITLVHGRSRSGCC